MNATFTVQDGIDIQTANLAFWRAVLNDEAYNLLKMKCEAENAALPPDATGYDVFRGQDLDNYLQNTIIPTLRNA